MTCHFDPVEYINELESAGVGEAQAKAHARALQRALQKVASVDDLEAMGARILRELESFKAAVLDQFKAIDIRLTQLEGRLSALDTRVVAVETKVAENGSELRMHRWALGFLGALQVATFAKVLML